MRACMGVYRDVSKELGVCHTCVAGETQAADVVHHDIALGLVSREDAGFDAGEARRKYPAAEGADASGCGVARLCKDGSPLAEGPGGLLEDTAAGIAFRVWPAAVLLSEHLAELLPRAEDVHPAAALEVGSGTGAVGIRLAELLPGVDVTLSDTSEAVQGPVLQENVRRAALLGRAPSPTSVAELEWGTDLTERSGPPRGSFGLIVGCDVTYFEHLHEALLCTLLQLVGAGTVVLIAHVFGRNPAFDAWPEKFRPFFDVQLAARLGDVNDVDTWAGEAKLSLEVYRLRLMVDDEVASAAAEGMLRRRTSDDAADLLARLDALERDLQHVQCDG